jgi:phage terminase large subunit
MCLIDLAQSHPGLVVSVCSETLPHLRKGAMREFLLLMQERGHFDPKAWNKSEFTYTFPNGTILEFFSVKDGAKVRGPGRDILFINECNNVPFETYRQLAMRTRKIIYLDSSEPKSNDELKNSYGILIAGAVKGEGSVNFGIQLLQQQEIYVTQGSTSIIKEYRNYLWKKDKITEQSLNVPVDAFNHAMDAARYAVSDLLAGKKSVFRVRSA